MLPSSDLLTADPLPFSDKVGELTKVVNLNCVHAHHCGRFVVGGLLHNLAVDLITDGLEFVTIHLK